MTRESIMDMDLSERIREIQQEEGRINRGPAADEHTRNLENNPINIAGPAGNPTQPGACEHKWISDGSHWVCEKCQQRAPLYSEYCGLTVSWTDAEQARNWEEFRAS